MLLCFNEGSYCTNCKTDEHLNFQCKYSDNPTLANYNIDKSYASLEVVEYVLFMGASEMLFRLESLMLNVKHLIELLIQCYLYASFTKII